MGWLWAESPTSAGGHPLETEDRGDRGGLRIVLSEVDEYLHILRRALRRDSEITIGVHTQVPGGHLRIADRSHLLYVIGHSM